MCMYVCMYVYVCMYLCEYVCVCMYVCVFVCMCLCMCVCMFVCVCVCVIYSTDDAACKQHRRCYIPQSSAPEDGRNYRPKHVELIEIVNKVIIVASSWLFVLL